MVRILLGHGWRLFREALSTVLDSQDDLSVVVEVTDADEVLAHALPARPDVVVLDVALPGPEAVQTLCQSLSDALPECGILVLMDRRANASAGVALARLAPRVGTIGTDASPADLIDAIRQIAQGQIVLDPRLAVAALTAESNPLTEREREVLRMAAAGVPTKDIARELHLSAGTVRNCMSRVLAKTGARTRIEALRFAKDSGWI
jgi:two-component system response regulator DesR